MKRTWRVPNYNYTEKKEVNSWRRQRLSFTDFDRKRNTSLNAVSPVFLPEQCRSL